MIEGAVHNDGVVIYHPDQESPPAKAQLPWPCSTPRCGPGFWACWIPPQPRAYKHSSIPFSSSVLPERFGESPLSRSLCGSSAVSLWTMGSQAS